MERLTVPDKRIDERTTRRTIIDTIAVQKHAMEFYWRLKAYEDAEEHGLLVRLPCQVKDKAFVLEIEDEDGGEERLFEGIVTRICIMNGQITVTIGAMERDCWFSETERRLSDIGIDWFLTREEAEKALEEENRNG